MDQVCAAHIQPFEPGDRSRDVDRLSAVLKHLIVVSPRIGWVNQANASAMGQLVLMSLGVGRGRYYKNDSSDY